MEAAKVTGRRVSISGMLNFLGVSRSGYRSFLNRKVSPSRRRKAAVKKEIQEIYDNSKQNYGAPKISQELRKSGETISQRTVGKYMREMGIRAQWTKPWTTTTRDSDFSKELHNVLNEQFNPDRPNAVWCTDITYIWTQDGFVYLNCVMDLYARKSLPGLLQILWKYLQLLKLSTKLKLVVILTSHLLFILIVEVNMYQLRGVKPLKQCREVILTAAILMITLASNRSTP